MGNGQSTYRMLTVGKIVPTPDNPRKVHSPQKEDELAASVRRDGVLQPLLVRPHPTKKGKYDLRAGGRRLAAAKKAKLKEVPCMIREMDDEAALRATVVENLQREDLTPFEESEAIRVLRDKGWSHEDVAEQIGKSPGWVMRRAALGNLTPAWQRAVLREDEPRPAREDMADWPVGHLELVARMPTEVQDELLQRWWHGTPSVKALRSELDRHMRCLSGAPWRHDEELNGLPKCAECMQRTDRQPHLFDDLQEDGRAGHCLLPSCWKAKGQAWVKAEAGRMVEEHGADRVLFIKDRLDDKPPVPGRTAMHWEVDKVDGKRKRDAVACLVISGSQAGQKFWGKLRREADAKRTGPTPLAERREKLMQRRHAWIVGKLIENIKAWRVPPTQELLAFAAAFGTAHRNDSPGEIITYRAGRGRYHRKNPWKLFRNWSVEPDTAPEELWKSVKAVLRARLKFQNLSHVPVPEATEIAGLLHYAWKALEEGAAQALPEPKAWAKLNEDGTPKGKAGQVAEGHEADGKSSKTRKRRGAWAQKAQRGLCRECGCTESTPCMSSLGPCAWTDKTKTLCSACGELSRAACGELSRAACGELSRAACAEGV